MSGARPLPTEPAPPENAITVLRSWRDAALELSERDGVEPYVRWEESGKAWAFARAIEVLKVTRA